MRKLVFVALAVVLLLLGGCDMWKSKDNAAENNIRIITSESFFHEFYVENNKVYYRCEVTIENKYDSEKTVRLIAHSPKDVELGLISNQELYAADQSGNLSEFTLAPRSKTNFKVFFVGDFAGTKQKHDRNLPNIEIVEVK